MPDPADRTTRVVHLVAKTHLDLGFTALAAEVAAQYRDGFFPRAIRTAQELRERGGPERLCWTTGSWILHHALTAGTDARREELEAAIGRGDLAWHGLPLTFHTELLDAALFRTALGISAELDARFGRTTTAAKMTDVPGHTRAMVPLLAEAGITFLHIGVNPAWPVPDVPPVFRWRSPGGPDGGEAEVTVAYQAGGYGGEVVVDGCDEVLAFLHTGDNLGPPTADDVIEAHADLAARHPGAEVRASTLDAFARALSSSGAVDGLPVVTSEIGDPWLFGAASDPQKLAGYLTLRRQLDSRAARHLTPDAAVAVGRDLLLVAEHTWGLDVKVALAGDGRWDRNDLTGVRLGDGGHRFEESWREQRTYVDRAAGRLADALAGRARRPNRSMGTLASVSHADPALRLRPSELARTIEVGEEIDLGHGRVRIDEHGALDLLVHGSSERVLASTGNELGRVRYQTFDEADYERFYAGLSPRPEDGWWARQDNTKPGIDACGAVSRWWDPRLSQAWVDLDDQGWAMVSIDLSFDGPATERFGAPPSLRLEWTWDEERAPDLTLAWFDKPASRLPEALWCSFSPVVAEPDRWMLAKLGRSVSPLDVVRHGGRSLHAVESAWYDGPDGLLGMIPFDAPLVAPGRPNLLDADPPVPDLAGGLHVLLHDNLWGTNFPMWSEGDATFGFALTTDRFDLRS
jgi:hypothetical protein